MGLIVLWVCHCRAVHLLIHTRKLTSQTTELPVCARPFLNASSVPQSTSMMAATPGARSSASTAVSQVLQHAARDIFSFCSVWPCQQIASRSHLWKLVVSLCVHAPPPPRRLDRTQGTKCWGDRNTNTWCGCSSAALAREFQHRINLLSPLHTRRTHSTAYEL